MNVKEHWLRRDWVGEMGKAEYNFDVLHRGVAQLVARAHGVREVAGSNPVSPTGI